MEGGGKCGSSGEGGERAGGGNSREKPGRKEGSSLEMAAIRCGQDGRGGDGKAVDGEAWPGAGHSHALCQQVRAHPKGAGSL